jgi:hypothetical protein
MRAFVVVVVTVGVTFVSLLGLLSVWSDLYSPIELPFLVQPDEGEEPYGDTSEIPEFADDAVPAHSVGVAGISIRAR